MLCDLFARRMDGLERLYQGRILVPHILVINIPRLTLLDRQTYRLRQDWSVESYLIYRHALPATSPHLKPRS